MKNLTILSTIFLISSCAFHSGTLTSNVTDKPVVHTDIATGVASTNIVLNIGGLSKDALISEARKNMIRARPLEGAEQYNNIEVNIKNTYYIFGRKTKVTINADVIEPKDSLDQPTYSDNYLKKIKNPEPNGGLFSIGDSVLIYNYNYQSGEIVRFLGESFDRIEISYTDSNNATRTKKVSAKRVYRTIKEHRGMTLRKRTEYGVIVGFGINRVLVKMSDGYSTEKYPKKKEK